MHSLGLTFAPKAKHFLWAGIGTALIVILAWILFKEDMDWYKVVGVLSIIFGVVLLKLQATA